jgi:hypothetical protein
MPPGGETNEQRFKMALGAIAAGLILLALVALLQGPQELTALASALTAGAALAASTTRKEK